MANRLRPIVVLADDLSGAAESAATFLARDVEVVIDIDTLRPGSGIRVVDLGSRALTPEGAASQLKETLNSIPSGSKILKKIDSMLRGNIRAEVEVLAARGPVVFVAALPALDRIVVDGVLHIDGTPLHLGDRWAMETGVVPSSIRALLGSDDVPVVHSADDIATRAHGGAVVVCDARSDADLDAIVAVAESIPGVILVGTAALAAAVARTLPVRHVHDGEPAHVEPARPVLVVVGTAETVAVEQVRVLVANGANHVTVEVDDLLAGSVDPGAVIRALSDGLAVLTVSGTVDPARAHATALALGSLVDAVARDSAATVDFVLTGGETARRVVDALGVLTLTPRAEIHHGAVVSDTDAGYRIATRPGSFGDSDSLLRISSHLRSADRALPFLSQ